MRQNSLGSVIVSVRTHEVSTKIRGRIGRTIGNLINSGVHKQCTYSIMHDVGVITSTELHFPPSQINPVVRQPNKQVSLVISGTDITQHAKTTTTTTKRSKFVKCHISTFNTAARKIQVYLFMHEIAALHGFLWSKERRSAGWCREKNKIHKDIKHNVVL